MTFLKHIALYILSIFVFVSITKAQSSKDSVKNLKVDEQISVYSKIGENLLSTNFVESEKNFNKAYNLAKSINNKIEEGNALHNLGKLYLKKNNIDGARKYFGKAISIREEIKDNENLAKSLNQLGIILQDRGQLDSALELYERSYKAAESAKYLRGMAIAMKQEGNIYNFKGQYQQAITYYMKALEIVEKSKSEDVMLSTYNNIGIVYNNLFKRKEALVYYRKSLSLAKKNKSPLEIGNSNSIIASMFLKKDTAGVEKNSFYNLDSGTIYLKEALRNFEIANFPLGISQCMHNLGQVYFQQKKYIQSIRECDSAIAIGSFAGFTGQHDQSVAIGYFAGSEY